VTNRAPHDDPLIILESDVTSDYPDLPDSVPEAVRDKLLTIHDISKARNSAARDASQEARDADTDRMMAQSRVQELERHGLNEKNNPAIVEARGRIARSEAAAIKARSRLEKLSPAWQSAHRLSVSLFDYVRINAAGGIVLHNGDVPQLRVGEKALDGLERAARRTRALVADRSQVRSAPFPSGLAKKIAWEQLQARAEAARPDVTVVVDRLGEVNFPTTRIEQYGGSSDLFAIDAVALFTLLAPDLMRNFIDREIDAVAEDEVALSATDRVERLAVIDGDILASEREEVAFAELAGLLPRVDIDPRAALGLAASMPAPEDRR